MLICSWFAWWRETTTPIGHRADIQLRRFLKGAGRTSDVPRPRRPRNPFPFAEQYLPDCGFLYYRSRLPFSDDSKSYVHIKRSNTRPQKRKYVIGFPPPFFVAWANLWRIVKYRSIGHFFSFIATSLVLLRIDAAHQVFISSGLMFLSLGSLWPAVRAQSIFFYRIKR